MEAERIRLFWQPGCTSCVKIKELLTEAGMEFESVNILTHPTGLDEMQQRGIMTVPVVFKNEEYIFGQSLDDVATFVGIDRKVSRLPMAELASKWCTFLDTAKDLIAQIPEDKLNERAFHGRPRTLRQLSYHIFQIPDGFVTSLEKGMEDTRSITNASYDHLQTKDDLGVYAAEQIRRLKDWIAAMPANAGDQRVKTYYGEQPLSGIFERGTWHSGQHTRQLDQVIQDTTGASSAIPKEVYSGLPMPKGMWD
jgi:glutaredoxin